jgi:Raf kinase inhibitor-like YbhB/YbcL family protein
VPKGDHVTLTLTSSGFDRDGPIPRSFAHSSGDVSRPLQWGGIPDGTVELVLLVDDPDAPIKGSFVPWVLFRIAPSRSGLAEGESPAEAQAGTNGFGRLGYLGPAPPAGDPPHHYVFRLLAVDALIEVKGHPSYSEVEAATDGHVLATATLVGTYRP